MRVRSLLFFTFFLLWLQSSFCQTIRTFESLGFDDQSIVNVTGSLTYFIKFKPSEVLEQCHLIINYKVSSVLNPQRSFLIINMKDQSVFTQRINPVASDSIFSIDLPLNSSYLQPDGRYIKLRIAARMVIGDDLCKDADNPALWCSILNSSFIYTIAKKDEDRYVLSLKELLPEYSTIYSPINGDVNDLTCGGVLYSLLKANNSKRINFTSTYTPNDHINDGVIIGSIGKLPKGIAQELPPITAGQGVIDQLNLKINNEEHSVLVITGADAAGYEKSINYLCSNKRISSAFTGKVVIEKALPGYSNIQTQSPYVATLEDLGASPIVLQGVGALKTSYNFSLSEFNEIPEKLTFHFDCLFAYLRPDDRGFLNIYLNESLVYSTNIVNKVNIEQDIELKTYLLQKFNNIRIEFRTSLLNDNCKGGNEFFAFVNIKRSSLSFSGEKENKFYSFFDFPSEFKKKATKVVVSPALFNSNIISSIGELYYQLNTPLNPYYNRLITPYIVSSDKTSMDDLKDDNIICFMRRDDPFIKNFPSMPVHYEKDFQLYKDKQSNVVYNINDFSSSGMGQIFREKNSTVMVLTNLGADSSNNNAFLSVSRNLNTQLTDIESNVFIANSNGLSNFFFKLPEDSNLVSYKGEKNQWVVFWTKYKLIILAIFLLGSIGVFWWIRNKVKESQATFKNV